MLQRESRGLAKQSYVTLVSGMGWHVQDLLRAAAALDIDLRPVFFSTLQGRLSAAGSGGVDAGGRLHLFACAGVLVRMMPPGSLEQVVFRMDALHLVQAAGVPVLNSPRAIEISVDKYLATARISAAGLPVPETWCGERANDALAAFDRLGGDVVVKPLFGSEGRGMARVTDPEIALRVFRAIERIGGVIYLQRFICGAASDLRVFVLGDRVLGAIRRHAKSGEWRANVSLGARAESVTLPAEYYALALRAARAVEARMAGIDLIVDPVSARPYVIEANAVPGWKALAAATGVDVAKEILLELRRPAS